MKYAFFITNRCCACLLLVATVFFVSCKKALEVQPPPDILVSADVFTSDAKATAVITSIYGSLINGSNGFSNHMVTLHAGYAADDLLAFNPAIVQQEFMENSILPANALLKTAWSTAYKHVYYCNAALEGLEASTGVSSSLKSQLIAECRFIRAFCYFYLSNLWGDVPVLLSTDYRQNGVAPRSPLADVQKAIEDDLLAAKNGLPLPAGTDKTRPSRWAAAAFLAKHYLYTKQWAKAEAEADAILSTGLYTPLQAPATVYLANSKEAIFQLAPTTGLMKETANLRPLGGAPQHYLRPSLVASFAAGDTRRARWLDSITYQSVKYYYPARYRNTATTPTEFYMVLRAAEQVLIRAEARWQLGNFSGAITDVNTIKTRAGVPLLPATATSGQVWDAIEKERLLEFFAEWGHRWFDLKRWGRASAVLTPLKPAFNGTDTLFPIPEDELLLNPFLTQNPGY